MGTTQLERLENPTDADGVAYHGLITAMEAVDHPDDPPTELAEIAGRLRLRRDDRRVLRWVVHDGDAMIGHVVLVLPDIDNQHLALSNVLCVGGSWVAPAAAMDAGRWEEITRLAAEAVATFGK